MKMEILVIMVLRGTEAQKREALAVLGVLNFCRIIQAASGDIRVGGKEQP